MVEPQAGTSKYAGKRLLIVDDDADMRLLLAEYFRRLGFQVEERESGAEALEPATTGRFDCFIFDVSMPGMTGFELLKRVRDRSVQTPALFLTAHDALDYKVAGYEAGADDYLAKPFSPRELEYRVEALPPLVNNQIANLDPFIIFLRLDRAGATQPGMCHESRA